MMDVVTLMRAKKYIDAQINSIAALAPFSFQGGVDDVEDLPETSTAGYVYVVRADGTARVWDGEEWVVIGKDWDDYVPVVLHSFTDAEKTQARSNIGAQAAIADLEDFIKVSAQTFTDSEKAQARTNIGALGSEDFASATVGGVIKSAASRGTVMTNGVLVGSTKTAEEYADALNSLFVCKGTLENIKQGGFVPVCTAEDAGKILTVNASGVPEWTAAE